MADCKHEFIGTAEGVECSLCGVKMSHDEFVDFLSGKKPEPEEEKVVVKKPATKSTKTSKKK